MLTFQTAPNFESPTDADADNAYEVLVEVFDGVHTTTRAVTVNVTGINEFAPVILSGPTYSVSENSTAVTNIFAIDGDLPGDNLVYMISGTDAGDLSIDSSTGVLTFQTAPNFELPADADGNNVYDVTVTVFDGVYSTSQNLTVIVTNLNEFSPVITSGATYTVNENSTAVTTITATDADLPGDNLVFSISGTDAGDFTINSSTGVLTFQTAPNFESPTDADADNAYEVLVEVFDGVHTTTRAVTVNVTGINEFAPVILSGPTYSVSENSTAVTNIFAIDGDLPGDNLVYMISGTDAGDLSIDSSTGVLTFQTAPNFELPADADGNNAYDVTVTVFDGVYSTSQNLTVIVTAANEFSPVITSGPTYSVNENSTAVTTITATDADLPGDNLVFSISGTDAGDFTINSSTGVLTFQTAPNFESPTDADADNAYEVLVEVFDGVHTTTRAVTVNVTGINEFAPVILSGPTYSVSENSTAVTTIIATDADLPGDNLVYMISGTDAGDFSIDSSTGVLTFQTAPNFELPADADGNNDYDIVLTVFDGIHTTIRLLTVSVLNVNELAPVITPGQIFTIQETAADGDIVGTTLAYDPDFDALSSWAITGGNTDGIFSIDAVTGEILVVDSTQLPQNAATYDLTITVTDGLFTSVAESVRINVNNVNDAPVGSPAIVGLTSVGHTLVADTNSISDNDGLGAFTYKWLRDGVEIVGETLDSYLLTVADVGQRIQVEVSYIDGGLQLEGPLTSLQTAIVQSNFAATGLPVILGLAQEDETLTVDTQAIDDLDGLGTFSYQWLRNGASVAGATSSTYRLSDADVGAQMQVQVRFVDNLGNSEGPLASLDTSVVVGVNDLPTGLPIIVGRAVEYNSLSANTSQIVDADGLGTFSYQWFRNRVAILGANRPSYTLSADDIDQKVSVQVNYLDRQGTRESLHSTATDLVSDFNSPPTISLIPTILNWNEQTLSSDLKVADIVVSDDLVGVNSVTLLGADAALFTIRNSTELFLRSGATLDFETQNVLNVTVRVHDRSLSPTTADTSVYSMAINDVNDAPRLNINQNVVSISSTESSFPLTIATFIVSDDALGSSNVQLSGADSQFFRISGNEIQLIDGSQLFEKTEFTLNVVVTDSSIPSSQTQTIVINVIQAAPNPTNSQITSTIVTQTVANSATAESAEETVVRSSSEEPLAAAPAGLASPVATENYRVTISNSSTDNQPGDSLSKVEKSDAIVGFGFAQSSESEAIDSSKLYSVTLVSSNLRSFSTDLTTFAVTNFSTIFASDGIMWEKLDTLQESVASNSQFQEVVMGSVSAVTSSLTVGYVIWMIRGGVIASTILAQLPAWRYMDAMVVLSHFENNVDDESGSLEAIVDRDLDEDETSEIDLASSSESSQS